MKPARLLWMSVAAVIGMFYLAARERRRREQWDALTGIPVDAQGRVLGDDGKPLAMRHIKTGAGEYFDVLAFQREVDAKLGL